MDTQNLKAFLSVAKHSSFSLAGEELHLTQPAISKRISLLEQELNLRLFDRIGRNVSLTQHGQQLVPYAMDILRRIDQAKQELLDTGDQVAGRLAIAISHHIGLHRLPPVLKEFSKRYPSVQLDIEFTDSELAYTAVLKGEVELAVITLAPQQDEQISAQLIWPDPLCFAVSPEHELSKAGSLQLEQLSEHTAILPNRNTYTGMIVSSLFAQRKLALQISMATNYMETIKSMAAIGLGWTVIPESMLGHELIKLDVQGPPIARELGLIQHRKRHPSNAAKVFNNTLSQFAET